MIVRCKFCKKDMTVSAWQRIVNQMIRDGRKYYNSKGELETIKEVEKCDCSESEARRLQKKLAKEFSLFTSYHDGDITV